MKLKPSLLFDPSGTASPAAPGTAGPTPAAPSEYHAKQGIEIKNIIFDFGNVICDIDIARTESAFRKLAAAKGQAETKRIDPKIFEELELGRISPDTFRKRVRDHLSPGVTDEEIDAAWNALLLEIPPQRVRLLENLKNNYTLFLLSNSNEIHYRKYLRDFQLKFGYTGFESLFTTAWFSFRIGMAKPDPAIFHYVVNQSGINPGETLFIDDTLVHCQGARKAGLHAFHLDQEQGLDVTGLFC